MKVTVVGAGYVGLIQAAGLAELGHEVTLLDIDKSKVDAVLSAKAPIYEPGLEELLAKHIGKSLGATTSYEEALKDAEAIFICVQTPSKDSGEVELDYVFAAAKDIGAQLRATKVEPIVAVKSTVIPGTTEKVAAQVSEAAGRKIIAVSNPEFLREGSAVKDFFKTDRIVIGTSDDKAAEILKRLYAGIKTKFVVTDTKTAEMIKYASNSFLAAKISLSNEVGNICKAYGIDAYKVLEVVGMDKRIGSAFLKSGIGFGGSCFPKDVRALITAAKLENYQPRLLEAVLELNEAQPLRVVEMLEKKVGALGGKRIAILGLAFKADTDDVRESRAIPVIKELIARKAEVVAYDPMAEANMRKIFPEINYAPSAKEALRGAHGCLILADWAEFKKLTYKDFSGMAPPRVIVEGRRVLDSKKVKGFEGVCW